jgi:forkhead protein FKH
MASIDYHNDIVQKSAQAFAKVAGRDWTFYVTSLRVIIGRPRQSKASSNGAEPPAAGTHESPRSPLSDLAVDIDLGPDMQVSRLHAEISFDGESGRWVISVNGRNGLHLDNVRLERGQQAWLQSGNVINILGTQMMFMLPGSPPTIHPEIRKQLLGEDEDMSDSGAKEEKQMPPTSGGRGRGRGANSFQTSGIHPQQNRSYNLDMEPGTQLHPGTPITKKESSQPRSKPSPTYNRGVMMESTEEIDYSADSAKDIKPPHSYAAMIGQAIMSTPEHNATLAKIYEYIKENYAFFRHNGGGWQNSIRHNLSLSKCFEKIPRRTDEPGKGMKWQIVPEYREEFLKKNIQPPRRVRHVGSSGPNSPAHMSGLLGHSSGAVAQTERLMGVIGQSSMSQSRGMKRSRSITPPLSYAQGESSFTPDRPQQPSFLTGPLPTTQSSETPPSKNEQLTPVYTRGESRFQTQPLQTHLGGPAQPEGLRVVSFNSPPTLTSSQYDLGGPTGNHLFTPLVARSKTSAAIQSTCKAPSHYAKDLFSSPAPFWRYVDIGSTPARLPEMSPSKPVGDDDDASPVKAGDEGEDVDEKPISLTQHPSSPPVFPPADDNQGPDDEVASPTRTISRPTSRSVGSVLAQGGGHDIVDEPSTSEPERVSTPSRIGGPITLAQKMDTGEPGGAMASAYAPLPPMLGLGAGGSMNAGALGSGVVGTRNNRGLPFARMELEDDDEDGGVDLTKYVSFLIFHYFFW